MSHHTMQLSEPDPNHPGFTRRYYATIDVSMSGSTWTWCQVDAHGSYFGQPSQGHTTEDIALNDALSKLNGDEWL